jgi:hypothetical protein
VPLSFLTANISLENRKASSLSQILFLYNNPLSSTPLCIRSLKEKSKKIKESKREPIFSFCAFGGQVEKKRKEKE